MSIFFKASILKKKINPDDTLGIVPTMGSLHSGHASLIRKAVFENSLVIVSIFINPTQFENKEDLNNYPRSIDSDVELIKNISENILIYVPRSKDIYENSVAALSYDFGLVGRIMEAKYRTGHFNGVATIVEKLLLLFNPNKAYFGEKDFQQLHIVKLLVKQKKINTRIVGCPILRGKNGIALSSRNKLLNKKQIEAASFIHDQLTFARSLWERKSAKEIIKKIKSSFLEKNYFKLDYFDIRYENNFLNAKKKSKRKARAFVAVKIGEIRLIDNLQLDEL
tara:strand:+ start:6212 stop:7051 length:840 start_codon:yes stop_codon:yes gene_type:complete